MMRRIVTAVCLVFPLAAAPAMAQARPSWANMPVRADADNETGIREVSASSRSLIPLQTKLRFTTLILLPEADEIMDVVCGDRDFWVISVSGNIAHVKPAKAGAETNLNLVTASGAVYSFLLREGKPDGKPLTTPDLKVYVTADPATATPTRKYYSAAQLEAVQGELAAARANAETERKRADEQIAAFKRQFPTTLQFSYSAVKDEKPFHVHAIWHDDAFTYIQTDAKELPALYEVKDGKPALVNFQVEQGTYVVPKVLERAYLALGKERLAFEQRR
jgi:type IV secretory pathway VirB9-like protein